MPEITVAISVRNNGEYLEEALDSLSSQTLEDFKVLVLDDASDDETPRILAAHAAKDPRFEVFTAPCRLGIPAAANFLLEKTKTPYAARMDGDDICLPHRLEAQLEKAKENPDAALIGGLVEEVGNAGEGWGEYVEWVNNLKREEDIRLNCLTESPIPHPTWLYRVEEVKKAGGYRDGLFPEDYELFLRLLSLGKRAIKVDEAVLKWRDHPSRETRTSKRCSFDAFLRLKAAYYKKLVDGGALKAPEKPVALWGAGRTGKVALRGLRETGVEVSVLIDPQKAGRNESGLRVADPSEVDLSDYFVLTAVRFKNIRKMVEDYYGQKGLRFGEDYLWLY